MKNHQIENAIAFAFLCKTHGAYKIAHDYIRVRQLAKRLANIDVHNCNGTRYSGEHGDIEYQQAVDRVNIALKTVLDPFKLDYYHQSDPRGASLYVAQRIKGTTLDANTYMNGLAIF